MDDAPPAPHPRLEPVGIAFLILGSVDLVWGLVMITVTVLRAAGLVGAYGDLDLEPAFAHGRHVGEGLAVILSACAVPVGAVSVFAGYKMRRAEAYPLALAAAILNMFPCYQTTCCALFGLPLGIWALVTLMNAEVKASFRRA